MYNSWTRFFLGLTPVSESEKWEAFEELAAELYPTGPDHDDLWQRAGGKDADLKHWGNGHDRWRQALRKIRYGKRPRPTALLQRMLEDYPWNEHVRYLADSQLFGVSADC